MSYRYELFINKEEMLNRQDMMRVAGFECGFMPYTLGADYNIKQDSLNPDIVKMYPKEVYCLRYVNNTDVPDVEDVVMHKVIARMDTLIDIYNLRQKDKQVNGRKETLDW